MILKKLTTEHFDQFKKYHYDCKVNEVYKEKNWKIDDDKIKRSINKKLVNIRTVLRAGITKGIIPESYIPKIPLYRVDRNRLPKYLTDEKIIAIAYQLEGEKRLAFWIFRYTGARPKKSLREDDNGLKWKHIDWMRNKVRLYSKGQERFVPLHPTLKEMLIQWKRTTLNPDGHVVNYTRNTLTTYFRRAKKKAGIDKPRSVHILRHTAITKVMQTKNNIRIAQEFAGHKDISTTQIYIHVLENEVDEAVNEAFS